MCNISTIELYWTICRLLSLWSCMFVFFRHVVLTHNDTDMISTHSISHNVYAVILLSATVKP